MRGAPILTVQAILGHQHVDTTLGYARLYDGTVAADYYRAMARVEQRCAVDRDAVQPAPSVGELVALVDSLRVGTLSESQQQLVQALRAGLLGLESTRGSPVDTPGHECRRRAVQHELPLNQAARDLTTND